MSEQEIVEQEETVEEEFNEVEESTEESEDEFDNNSPSELDESDDSEEDDIDWKQRAINAEKALIASKRKKKQAKPTKNNDPEVIDRIQSLEVNENKREFGHKHNLSPKAVDYLFSIKKNPTKKDLKDPFIKGGIDALNKRERITNNTPREGSTVGGFINDSYKEMSKADKQKAFEDRIKSRYSK